MCPYQKECCRNCQMNSDKHPTTDVFAGRVLIAVLVVILLLAACGVIPLT